MTTKDLITSLDRICTHLIVFEGDSVAKMYLGNGSDYETMMTEKFGKDLTPHRVKYRTLKRQIQRDNHPYSLVCYSEPCKRLGENMFEWLNDNVPLVLVILSVFGLVGGSFSSTGLTFKFDTPKGKVNVFLVVIGSIGLLLIIFDYIMFVVNN